MSAFFALIRKQLGESRWMLALSAAALFGISWLGVWGTARFESRLRQADPERDFFRNRQMIQRFGGEAMDFSSGALEMVGWSHPFVILTVGLWAVARGSLAVAGELERGSLDLTMSRPVSRFAFYGSHVLSAALGLLVLAGAMVGGNLASSAYNPVEAPPRAVALIRASAELWGLGFAVFGYALLLSALDVVRWRPNLVASVATLAMFVAHIIASFPGLEDYKDVDRFSIFKAYNPVEAVVKGANAGFNVGVLLAIGVGAIALGFLAFNYRDLPSGGG